MADVFISYSKSHARLTKELARDLEAKGLSVWWDTELLAGESFRNRIVEELKDCKAAIVIWTRDSVRSDYVMSEAERARVAGKLIQLRTADLAPSELPPPFDTIHASLIEDRKAVYRALAGLGLLQDDSTVTPASPRRGRAADSRPPLWKRLAGRPVAATLAAIVAIGAVAAFIFPSTAPITYVKEAARLVSGALVSRTTAPAAPPPPAAEELAKKAANQFFNELNAGLKDSSLFDADVRLGRRGLMSRADAANELRKLFLKYSKINCRMDDGSLSLKTPAFAQSDVRTKVYADCDFTDKAGKAVTQRFPLEIELAARTALISGLWQSEEMVLWQPRGRD